MLPNQHIMKFIINLYKLLLRLMLLKTPNARWLMPSDLRRNQMIMIEGSDNQSIGWMYVDHEAITGKFSHLPVQWK